MNRRFAVVGTGVYGQYVVRCLLDYNFHVDWFDVENDYSDDWCQVGGDFNYMGFEKGRRFGTSGTAKIWGGQVFHLDESDRKYTSNEFFQEVFALNSADVKCEHTGKFY